VRHRGLRPFLDIVRQDRVVEDADPRARQRDGGSEVVGDAHRDRDDRIGLGIEPADQRAEMAVLGRARPPEHVRQGVVLGDDDAARRARFPPGEDGRQVLLRHAGDERVGIGRAQPVRQGRDARKGHGRLRAGEHGPEQRAEPRRVLTQRLEPPGQRAAGSQRDHPQR
jgi:hypothetical protein